MDKRPSMIWLVLRLELAALAACLLGAAITLVVTQSQQFTWSRSVPGINIPLWSLVGGAVLLVLAAVGSLLGFRLIAVWLWIRKSAAQSSISTPERIRRDALNLPAYYAGFIWLIWLGAACILAFQATGTFKAFFGIMAGVGILAGFSSAVFAFFLVEWFWRYSLPSLFVGHDILTTQAFRLRLRNRLLIFFILSIIPMILSVLFVQSRLTQGAIAGASVVLALLLAWLASNAMAHPLETITPQLAAVQKGKLDEEVRVAVFSNDEIGEIASGFNNMVASVRLRNSEVETIYHISQEITESLELNATLQSILEEVHNIIPYDGAEICLYDRNDNLLHVGAWASSAKVIIDTRGRTYKLGEGYTGWVGETRQSLLIPDVDAHHGHKPTIRQIAEGVFLNGYLGVPLVVKGNKMVGTLELVSTNKNVFDEHSQQILEIIAPQAAIAIDNAEQVMERERELKAQIERLKIEIDDVKRAQQVADITETSYFRNLKEQAQKLREASRAADDEV